MSWRGQTLEEFKRSVVVNAHISEFEERRGLAALHRIVAQRQRNAIQSVEPHEGKLVSIPEAVTGVSILGKWLIGGLATTVAGLVSWFGLDMHIRLGALDRRVTEIEAKYVDRDHFDQAIDSINIRIDALLNQTTQIYRHCAAIHAASKLPPIEP